jgi:CDP-diacylglycerol--serine O-phosphatidyltransferase
MERSVEGGGRQPAWWRYALPNAMTATSLVFGVLGVQAAVRGLPIAGAWWALYCTLTDKLDGALAKALHGQSSFGVQFDSLADLLSFGVVPPTIIYTFFVHHPELGWSSSLGRALLVVLCASFTIAAAVRLARFNVGTTAGHSAYYTGTPSTMTAGIVGALFLTCIKYSAPSVRGGETLDHWRLLDGIQLDAWLPYLPLLLGAGAIGMVSPLRVPRLGRTRSRVTDVLLVASAGAGYALGLFHRLPEYLAGGGLFYLGLCLVSQDKLRRADGAKPD